MEDPGISGGTPVCNVSPSDIAANVNNLLERVQKLENTVAQILSGNVEATQLSDLSSDLGWIFNITYLGEDGWAQTPAGTLIAPPGATGYLSSILDGQTGLYIGGAAGSRRPCLHKKNATTSADLSGTNYLAVNTDMISYLDTSYNGTTYLTSGTTDTTGKNAWGINVDGLYNFIGSVYIQEGTSAPTTGTVNAILYRRDTSVPHYDVIANLGLGVPAGGLSGEYLYFPLFGRSLFDNGDYLLLAITNSTDGDIKVYYSELIGTLEIAV